MDKVAQSERMRNFSAKDAKNRFGLMIDEARLAPVVIEKHGRPVAVVCSVEEFERMKALAHGIEPDGDA
jgi:prevent-host-death family protein